MNVRNQEHTQQQAQQLAKHGIGAITASGPAPRAWYVVGRYRTQSGRIGAEIRTCASTGRLSYTGAWGAGSGHCTAGMVRMLNDMLRGRRGWTAEIPFHAGH